MPPVLQASWVRVRPAPLLFTTSRQPRRPTPLTALPTLPRGPVLTYAPDRARRRCHGRHRRRGFSMRGRRGQRARMGRTRRHRAWTWVRAGHFTRGMSWRGGRGRAGVTRRHRLRHGVRTTEGLRRTRWDCWGVDEWIRRVGARVGRRWASRGMWGIAARRSGEGQGAWMVLDLTASVSQQDYHIRS